MAATTRARQKRMEQLSTKDKLLHWLFFGVIMSLVPFAATVFGDLDRGIGMSLSNLFGQGQLLIIATIISAGGIGDLFGTAADKSRRTPKLLVLGFSLINLVVTCLWFADISALVVTRHPADPGTVAVGSIILFVFAVMEGVSALALTEG